VVTARKPSITILSIMAATALTLLEVLLHVMAQLWCDELVEWEIPEAE